VEVSHPSQKFERLPFWNSYGIKHFGCGVTFNGVTFLLIFIKNLPSDSELIGGTETHTDKSHTQGGYFMSLRFSFGKESRLKSLSSLLRIRSPSPVSIM
jgi:hypothetical protein